MKKFILIFTFLLAIQLKGSAQELLDTEDGPPDPVGVPVDGGLSLLLAAGAGYAGRRLWKHRQDQRSTDKV